MLRQGAASGQDCPVRSRQKPFGYYDATLVGGWQVPVPHVEFHSMQEWTFALVTKTGADGNFWGLFNIVCFFAKVIGLILFFMFVRWTVPRFRYDQLMSLGWKVMIPLGLMNLLVSAVVPARSTFVLSESSARTPRFRDR
jgi:NADH:ubiquinone oxidoreductase subunit H